MKYLIGLDIDGTILTDHEELQEETIAYLRSLCDDGHIVCLLTGRPFRTTLPIYQKLGLKTPVGNYSGSLVTHPYDEHFPKLSFKMSSKHIKKVMRDFKEKIMNAFCELDHELRLYRESDELVKWLDQGELPLIIGDFDFEDDINGAVIFLDASERENIDAYLNKLDTIGHRYWKSLKEEEYIVIELYTLAASKATAMEHIRQYYNIPFEHTIAIGDGSNDVEMLAYANYSAAMENASDYIKKHAKDVTTSNNDFGVINYLKKITKK